MFVTNNTNLSYTMCHKYQVSLDYEIQVNILAHAVTFEVPTYNRFEYSTSNIIEALSHLYSYNTTNVQICVLRCVQYSTIEVILCYRPIPKSGSFGHNRYLSSDLSSCLEKVKCPRSCISLKIPHS